MGKKQSDYSINAFIFSGTISLLIGFYINTKVDNGMAWISTIFIGTIINLIYLIYKKGENSEEATVNGQDLGGAILSGVVAGFILTILDVLING